MSELKLVQNNRWKCQWWISGNEMPKSRGASTSRRWTMSAGASKPAPKVHFYVFGYVTPKSMTRLGTFQDIQPRRYDIQRDALCTVQKKGLVCNQPTNRREKNDEKMLRRGSSGFGLCRSCLPSLQSLRRREFLAGNPRDGQCHGARLRVIGGCLCRCHRLEGRGGCGR